jgi:hypothetical protein
MSNVALFNNQLPDYLKEVQLDDVTRALAGDSQVKRIALGNNKFVLKVNGTEVSKTNTDKLEVVIVNASKHISRTFYAKEWDPKNTTVTPPDCWSNDGEKPDPSVKEPQSATCMGCPQDINGSGQGNTKACRKNRRIAVALASDLDGDVYQMTLQSKSIFYDMKDPGDLDHMPFNQYAKYVGSQGYNLNTLVTEMRFDEDSTVGKLFFRPVRFLERHEWEQAKKLGETPAAKNAVTMTIAQADSAKPKLEAPKAKAEVAKVAVEVDEEVSEPKKREDKKAEPTPKRDLKSVMSGWSTDDEA